MSPLTRPDSAMLQRYSYKKLSGLFDAQLLDQIRDDCLGLYNEAQGIIQYVQNERCGFDRYYRNYPNSLIAVAEYATPSEVCRFEYIRPNSSVIRAKLLPLLESKIGTILGASVRLFKDKCNLKVPGGGAFPWHQDIPAYRAFGPQFHITAAVFLDAANEQNGALEVASNYIDLANEGNASLLSTPLGDLPMFHCYQDGPRNGEIIEDISDQFEYTRIDADAGDVLLFNSYLPHRSKVNNSKGSRRAYFFTFNFADAGDHYERYYRSKREDFSNPQFHVATPTLRK